MTNMTLPTFETSFMRAMQLLQSPDKEATEQLKAMLDECFAQKKAQPIIVPTKPQPIVKPVVASRPPPPPPPVAVPAPILVPTDDTDRLSLSCVVCK